MIEIDDQINKIIQEIKNVKRENQQFYLLSEVNFLMIHKNRIILKYRLPD
jgi:hypothetical protein